MNRSHAAPLAARVASSRSGCRLPEIGFQTWRGINVKNHSPRTQSSTCSLVRGATGTGRSGPVNRPPVAGLTHGCARNLATAACSESGSAPRGPTNRPTSLPCEVTTISSPRCTRRRYSDRRALSPRTLTDMGADVVTTFATVVAYPIAGKRRRLRGGGVPGCPFSLDEEKINEADTRCA